MDAGYLHLIQLILIFILIFFCMYRFAVPCVKLRFAPAHVLLYRSYHPVYRHFRRRIAKRNLFAYDKYQIWRYVEKRKDSFKPEDTDNLEKFRLERSRTMRQEDLNEYFRRWFETGY